MTANPEPANDDILLMAIEGDMEAFGELYQKFSPKSFKVIFRILQNVFDAEDANQRLWTRLLSKLPQFRGGSGFPTWLHTSARNEALALLRSRRAMLNYISYEDLSVDKEEGLPYWMRKSIDNAVINREENKLINKIWAEEAIDKLAPGYRTVLLMHDLSGYEHQEISATLMTHEGTSKSQLSKGRNRIKKYLGEKY